MILYNRGYLLYNAIVRALGEILKELAKKKRAVWGISPVTRKTESKKVYNRKKRSHDREDEYGMGVFLCVFSVSPRSACMEIAGSL